MHAPIRLSHPKNSDDCRESASMYNMSQQLSLTGSESISNVAWADIYLMVATLPGRKNYMQNLLYIG